MFIICNYSLLEQLLRYINRGKRSPLSPPCISACCSFTLHPGWLNCLIDKSLVWRFPCIPTLWAIPMPVLLSSNISCAYKFSDSSGWILSCQPAVWKHSLTPHGICSAEVGWHWDVAVLPGCDALLTITGKGKKLLPSPGLAHGEWVSPYEGFSKLWQLRAA